MSYHKKTANSKYKIYKVETLRDTQEIKITFHPITPAENIQIKTKEKEEKEKWEKAHKKLNAKKHEERIKTRKAQSKIEIEEDLINKKKKNLFKVIPKNLDIYRPNGTGKNRLIELLQGRGKLNKPSQTDKRKLIDLITPDSVLIELKDIKCKCTSIGLILENYNISNLNGINEIRIEYFTCKEEDIDKQRAKWKTEGKQKRRIRERKKEEDRKKQMGVVSDNPNVLEQAIGSDKIKTMAARDSGVCIKRIQEHTMKTYKTYITVIIIPFILTTVANAYLVFGNYDGVNVSSSGVFVQYGTGPDLQNPAGTRWLSDFGWGGEDILIDSIEIYAQMNAGSSDNIHMYLYGYEGLIGILEPDETIGAAGNYMFSPTEPLTVTAAGIYNIIIQPDFVEGTWMSWYGSPDDIGSSYSDAVGESWGSWNSVGGSEPTYRVHYTVVPEPNTIALFLLGFSCIVARKKLRK